MNEAKRLNMLDGHFFWLWIDASRDIDVFHSIGNNTEYTEDNENETFIDKEEELKNDSTRRSKRDDVDNNTINESEHLHEISKEKLNDDSIVKNKSINFFRRSSRNKSEAHSVNNKLLYVNFSQSYDSSRNISSEAVRNFNVHNNKGVETSKIENNSIEKEKQSFPDRNNSRRSSYNKMKNESFNKYVNSINIESVNNADRKSFIEPEVINRDLKDSLLFSSDISDFLMNPTVHTSTMHNVRDTIEKRKNRSYKKHINIEDVNDNEESKSNITKIFNSLPVGLLALHPQPKKLGKSKYNAIKVVQRNVIN